VASPSVLDIQDQVFDVVAEEKPWQKIIVHSSLGQQGTMEDLDNAWNQFYISQGMPGNRGGGYHFVINDAKGHDDGVLEIAPRWEEQVYGDFLDGEFANQELRQSIGICVMGDVESGPFSPKQMDTLVSLIRVLQERYDIPRDRVEFRVAQGSDGVAPYFPEAEIRRRIRD